MGSLWKTSVLGLLLLAAARAGDVPAGSTASTVTAADPATGSTSGPSADPTEEVVDRRAYGVMPNYRTANYNSEFKPLTTRRKYYIATRDSFDYPVFLTGALFAGIAQANNTHPDFGQGASGYGKRYITAFADQSIANYLTEGVFPALLHQDPRYFRRGPSYGGPWKRTLYAVSRILISRTDRGTWQFNWSEVVGNAASAGISSIYYPKERTLGDNLQRLGTQLTTDGLSQVLKEFWPDLKRRFFQKRR